METTKERAAYLPGEGMAFRDGNRYKVLSSFLLGKKVLDVGCSTGHLFQFMPDNVIYEGVDYDSEIARIGNEAYKNDRFKIVNESVDQLMSRLKAKGGLQYDTIFASEILEHLPNGLLIAQELKNYCRRLVITVPFKEEKGFWGEFHVLHGLEHKHFPNFNNYGILHDDGRINDNHEHPNDLLIMMHTRPEKILAYLSTRSRTDSTLAMAIMSLINQTKKPDQIVIYDDNEKTPDYKPLHNHPVVGPMFKACDMNGIKWVLSEGKGKGQLVNHQDALKNSFEFAYVLRIDDDNVLKYDTLEKYYNNMSVDVGAVGGITPFMDLGIPFDKRPYNAQGKAYGMLMITPQWYIPDYYKPLEVEHLYSTFMYDRQKALEVGGYPDNLSQVGHTEETTFSHKLFLGGYKLLVLPDALTYHVRQPRGGIRDFTEKEMWDSDNVKYGEFLKANHPPEYTKPIKLIPVFGALGDNFMFKTIIPELKEVHKDYKITIATNYPEAYWDTDVEICKLAELDITKEPNFYDKHGIYTWAALNDNGNEFIGSIRKRYLEEAYGINTD